MMKQEVIIVACAFQQIIHILTNNNEERNVNELGVTVKSLEPATILAGASQPIVVRTERFFRMLRTSSLIQREHAQTNRLSRDSAWLSKQLKNGSGRPHALEPPKQPTEVITLIRTVSFK